MDDLTEVYNELIMEHSMNSYNKKKLENADYCEIGAQSKLWRRNYIRIKSKWRCN